MDLNKLINEIIESNLSTDTKRILTQLLYDYNRNTDIEYYKKQIEVACQVPKGYIDKTAPEMSIVFNTMGKEGHPNLDDLPFIFKQPKSDGKIELPSDTKIEPDGDK